MQELKKLLLKHMDKKVFVMTIQVFCRLLLLRTCQFSVTFKYNITKNEPPIGICKNN